VRPIALAAIIAIFCLGAAAHAAPVALVIDEGGSSAAAAVSVANSLAARGFSVDRRGILPFDLSPYCCIWDLRNFGGLPVGDWGPLRDFVLSGGGLHLTGENLGCCSGRNQDVEDFLATELSIPIVIDFFRDIPGTFDQIPVAGHPITDALPAGAVVTYNGSAVGIFTPASGGIDLTVNAAGGDPAAEAWDDSNVAGLGGRVTVVLDINWLAPPTFPAVNNDEFLDSMGVWLCPVSPSGVEVTVSTPDPFNEECPDPTTVSGTVDSGTDDCAGSFRVAPTPAMSATSALAPAVGLVPGGTSGDGSPSDLVPGLLPQATTVPAAPPPLINAIEVSVNGGPFAPVTSTSKVLPAAAPIDFSAIDLPLILGANSVTIRATDDNGDEGELLVLGSMDDTIDPVIDLSTCTDLTVDLDAACQASFDLLPALDDLCDPAPTITASPAQPLVFAAPSTTFVTYTARDASLNSAICGRAVQALDRLAPTLTCPAPSTVECSSIGGSPDTDPAVIAWLSAVAVADNCDPNPALADDAPAFFDSGCAPGTGTMVTWDATDASGNPASCSETLTVEDTTAPAITRTPGALTLECSVPGGVPEADPDVQAWLAEFAADDVCSAAVTLTDDHPPLFAAGCNPGLATSVEFSATDDCGNAAMSSHDLVVVDTTPPDLTAPGPLALECNFPGGVPDTDPTIQRWLNAASASDICDGATVSDDAPALFPSACAPGLDTTVSFEAVDDCNNLATEVSTVTVFDTTAPSLVVPAPLELECDGPSGIPATDPRIQVWLGSATATDICDSATITDDAPAFFSSGCVPGEVTVVTFTAVDDCGNAAELTSTVTVVDTTPPEIESTALEGACVWPPNHKYYCIDDLSSLVEASDVCDEDPLTVVITDCRSNQPDDDLGDGHTVNDCAIVNGGLGVCVRSERQGLDPAGRIYTITVGASDDCGNTATTETTIAIPHDQREHPECVRPNRGKNL